MKSSWLRNWVIFPVLITFAINAFGRGLQKSTGPQSPVIDAQGNVIITYTYGVPQEVVNRLLKELNNRDLKLAERDAAFKKMAIKYKKIEADLKKQPSTNSVAIHARTLLKEGDLDGAQELSEVPSTTKLNGQITFDSEINDYIGGGQKIRFTDSNSIIEATAFPSHIRLNIQSDDTWTIEFSAPQGKLLEPGVYNLAQRLPFNNPTKPGMAISGAGHGCNKLSGMFEIREIAFTQLKLLKSFSASFEQHCEGSTAALRGDLVLQQRI